MSAKCNGCRDGKGLDFTIRAAFQPIIDVVSGDVFAYEALVRGANGEPAAEVLNRVSDENRYAFDQQCRVTAIRDAVAAGILKTNAKLSINFMPNAVYQPSACIQLTLRTAREVGFPSDRLMFEFTENEKANPDHLKSIVRAYRELGFTTAIDDFGAGHSGLGLLANFQTDVIKLDMDLIRGIDSNSAKRAIVEAMMGLCRRLGIRVIAEGIETDAELKTVRLLGVRLAQGYLLGRPAMGQLSAFPPLFNQGLGERRRLIG